MSPPPSSRERRRSASQRTSRPAMAASDRPGARERLSRGEVIPAHPLALTAARKLDERRQRALTRYYLASGAGGIAVGVHTTQFAIRSVGLYRPVLEIAAAEEKNHKPLLLKIAGICGATMQATAEAACPL